VAELELLMLCDASGARRRFFDDLWQDLHDDDKTCMQSSYWELILENGQ
jgi:hypothetical protein